MSVLPEQFRFQFPGWYSELTTTEVGSWSRLGGVAVALPDDRRYSLCFIGSAYLREEGHDALQDDFHDSFHIVFRTGRHG